MITAKIQYKLSNKSSIKRYEIIPSEVKAAAEITQKTLTNKLIKEFFPQVPFASEWYCYNLFYNQMAHPLLSYAEFLNDAKNIYSITFLNYKVEDKLFLSKVCDFYKIHYIFYNEPNDYFLLIKTFLWNLLLFLITVCSVMAHSLNRNNKVGLWTGDYLDRTNTEPRLGNLKNQINRPVVEFIRTTGISPKQVIINFIKRKSLPVYYNSISYFHSFFIHGSKPSFDKIQDLPLFLMMSYLPEVEKEIALTLFWKRLFKLLKINNLIVWFFSHRTASLIWAAKQSKIKTIGFMHGLTTPDHMGHEYMPGFRDAPYGPDSFGVWSQYWLDKYKKHSNFYPENALKISGPIKTKVIPPNKKLTTSNDPINVLWVSEQSLPVEQALPFLNKVLANNKFKVFLKVRNFGQDGFCNKLREHYPEIAAKMKILKTDIPSAMSQADIIIGSHSTVVLESSLYRKPFIFFNTPMWGDYFQIQKMSSDFKIKFPIYANTPDELENALLSHSNSTSDDLNYLDDIATSFFGSVKSNGSDWVVSELQG